MIFIHSTCVVYCFLESKNCKLFWNVYQIDLIRQNAIFVTRHIQNSTLIQVLHQVFGYVEELTRWTVYICAIENRPKGSTLLAGYFWTFCSKQSPFQLNVFFPIFIIFMKASSEWDTLYRSQKKTNVCRNNSCVHLFYKLY